MATLGGVTAYTASGGDALAYGGATLVGAGTAVLAAGVLVRLSAAIPWAVAAAGGGYVLARTHHPVADGWAAAVGAALLLAAELAFWSHGTDRRIREEARLVVRRALTVTALVLASALVGFVLVGAAAVSAAAGVGFTALGVAAAVAAVAVVLRLARGPSARRPEA